MGVTFHYKVTCLRAEASERVSHLPQFCWLQGLEVSSGDREETDIVGRLKPRQLFIKPSPHQQTLMTSPGVHKECQHCPVR